MCKFATVLQLKGSTVKNICVWVGSILLWHRPTPSVFLRKKGGWGKTYIKGVYYALVLTIRNPEKISIILSRTKQREYPVVCLYIFHLCCTVVDVFLPSINYGAFGSIYISAWGVQRCSFRQDGQFSGASNREASNSNWASRLFFCLYGRWF